MSYCDTSGNSHTSTSLWTYAHNPYMHRSVWFRNGWLIGTSRPICRLGRMTTCVEPEWRCTTRNWALPSLECPLRKLLSKSVHGLIQHPADTRISDSRDGTSIGNIHRSIAIALPCLISRVCAFSCILHHDVVSFLVRGYEVNRNREMYGDVSKQTLIPCR